MNIFHIHFLRLSRAREIKQEMCHPYQSAGVFDFPTPGDVYSIPLINLRLFNQVGHVLRIKLIDKNVTPKE